METIKVKILEDGKTAREVNPISDNFNIDYEERGKRVIGKSLLAEMFHKEAEQKLRTFEIDFSHLDNFYKTLEEMAGGTITHINQGYEKGEIHTAQILETGKIRIVC